MRKSISWRGLNKLITFAKKRKKWRIPPLLGTGEKSFFLLFICLFSFKKAVNEGKTKFVFRLFD